ncbi:MAG TPA: FAD-dependent oxidoreductase [Candidatus Polarisedimenticolia bacterium]|jgi:sarcosine oxidase subunit beta|nr:FAD-dependent oxidoreductase [Candidatus Polarisedimenticolia bacterium]
MHTAEVVIIGGGIVGSSIAWHLTDAGCKNVLVIERESSQGKGSTGKSMGGVRAQFSTPVNIQMSLYSIPFYARFEEVVGHPADYRPQGYLFLATKESHLAYLRDNFARQEKLGLTTARLLPVEEICTMLPQLRSDDILGGSFCSTDGFVDPYSVMNGFMASAAEHGATLWKKTEVTGITIDQQGAFSVETTRGPVSTRTVVNAAGAWSAQIAKFVGIDLPVEPLRRMLVPSEPFSDFPHSSPMVIDMSTGFHFRPEGRGFLLAWNDPEETPGYKTDFEPSFIEKILMHAANRVPAFENLPVNPKRAWAGLYEMTPDHHCILGPVAGAPGFFLANGFSGHGVMHSPATGKILTGLILQGKTNVVDDVSVLGYERFARGELLHETAVL